MTPVFGTRGQHALYLLHRYSAIVLTVAVVLHLPALFRRPAARV
jgi:heme A synthase